MKVAVCLSTILDPDAPLSIMTGAGTQPGSGRPTTVNPGDLEALEVALQVKDHSEAATVLALSVAPPAEVEGVLRTARSVGADEIACVWDEGLADMDSLMTARVLAGAIRMFGVDLTLFGDRRLDGDTGQVPYQVAELLGLPCLDQALSLSVNDDGVVVEQPAGPGFRRRLRSSLPATVVVAPGGRTLRYPKTSDQLRARSIPISAIGLESLDGGSEQIRRGPGTRVLRLGLPKPVRRAPLAAAMTMPLRDRLRFIQGAGLSARSGRTISAEPADEAATAIMAFLRAEGLVTGEEIADGQVPGHGA